MGVTGFPKLARILFADGKHVGRTVVGCELDISCTNRARIGHRG
ncbi:hypothetical protein [Novosphingobium sp. G106]|nr:hypothetical protein [Novosphingobium sp. G106]